VEKTKSSLVRHRLAEFPFITAITVFINTATKKIATDHYSGVKLWQREIGEFHYLRVKLSDKTQSFCQNGMTLSKGLLFSTSRHMLGVQFITGL
jgi:hypothetical protein